MTDIGLKYIRNIFELLLVLSGVAVWFGIYLEQGKFSKKVQDRGWRLLVLGIAAETVLGFFLYLVDGSLSRHQAFALAASESETRAVEDTLSKATLAISASNNKLSEATLNLAKNADAMVKLSTLTADELHGLTVLGLSLLSATQPRVISNEQQQKLLHSVEAFPKVHFDVGISVSALDAGSLAAQIEDVLINRLRKNVFPKRLQHDSLCRRDQPPRRA